MTEIFMTKGRTLRLFTFYMKSIILNHHDVILVLSKFENVLKGREYEKNSMFND